MDRALLRRFRRRHNGGSVGHVSTALRLALVAVAIAPLAVLAVAAALAVGGLAIYSSYAQELPSAEEIRRLSVDTFETTRLYDRTGQHVLFEIMPQRMDQGKRTWVPLSRIPEHLRNGTIAAEDKTFYTNPAGINVEGLARAVVGLVRGEYAGGGSSITQQLVRNVIMPLAERLERSETRKIKELILSVELTRRYPGMEGRDQILEWYLNNVYYGRWAYGPEAAAQAYFGKHAEELTLAECAMLVPLGNLPTLLWEGDGLRYAWERDADLKRRQELVLTMMAEQGYITAAEAEAAKREAVVIAPLQVEMAAPHFVVYVRDILEKRYGREAVYGGGLQVITSIDLGIQAKAEELARKQIAAIRQERNAHNAAVVVLNTKTAEILAMVGSVDYNDLVIKGNINMAVTPRQPGSSFKPFVYATAFAQGYTPATMVMDVRTSFPDPSGGLPYVPENYSRSFRGPILLRQALGCSYNVPAVAVCQLVGPQKAVGTARAMGISTLQALVGGQVKRNLPADEYGLSVALGGYEITLLDMTYGFTVFANGGTMLGTPLQGEEPKPGFRRLDPVSVLRVTDAKGRLIDQYTEPQRQEVIRPEVAFLINDVLSDNQARTAAFGANSFMVIPDRPAAVKTGTTNEYRDGWAIGYTPQYAVGVWVGNAHNNEPMKNTPGVRA
ncbi:MAG: penicillin-binding protein, partial [Chloroflexi bacterium]|nr:penicillin-binding protein [Chloroflexota bacterium]